MLVEIVGGCMQVSTVMYEPAKMTAQTTWLVVSWLLLALSVSASWLEKQSVSLLSSIVLLLMLELCWSFFTEAKLLSKSGDILPCVGTGA